MFVDDEEKALDFQSCSYLFSGFLYKVLSSKVFLLNSEEGLLLGSKEEIRHEFQPFPVLNCRGFFGVS